MNGDLLCVSFMYLQGHGGLPLGLNCAPSSSSRELWAWIVIYQMSHELVCNERNCVKLFFFFFPLSFSPWPDPVTTLPPPHLFFFFSPPALMQGPDPVTSLHPPQLFFSFSLCQGIRCRCCCHVTPSKKTHTLQEAGSRGGFIIFIFFYSQLSGWSFFFFITHTTIMRRNLLHSSRGSIQKKKTLHSTREAQARTNSGRDERWQVTHACCFVFFLKTDVFPNSTKWKCRALLRLAFCCCFCFVLFFS